MLDNWESLQSLELPKLKITFGGVFFDIPVIIICFWLISIDILEFVILLMIYPKNICSKQNRRCKFKCF